MGRDGRAGRRFRPHATKTGNNPPEARNRQGCVASPRGSLLMYGIRSGKFDKKEAVLHRIELMKKEGIKFICTATVICTDAMQPRDLPIEVRKQITASSESKTIDAMVTVVVGGANGATASSEHTPGLRRSVIPGVRRALGLDQQEMRFFVRNGTVLHSARNHKHLSGRKDDFTVAQFDPQTTTQHQEKVIGLIVLVPHKLALDFNDHEVMTIELPDGPRLPVTAKRFEFLL